MNLISIKPQLKLLVTFFLLLSLGYSSVNAQSKTTKLKALTTDPLSMLLEDRFTVKYEFQLKKSWSLGKSNSLLIETGYDNAYNSEKVIAVPLGIGYRWYFHNIFPDIKTRRIEGLSVGPVLIYNFLHWTPPNDATTKTYYALDIGGEISYKFFFNQFVVEPSIRLLQKNSSYPSYDIGFRPIVCLNLGYSW